jgi:uncharacterized protein YndB with AHSA1/START domain
MSRQIRVEAVIGRPPEVVFDLISDPTNDPRWCATVSDVHIESVEEDGSTRYRFTQHVGPLRHEEEAKIVELDRPTRIRWRFTAMGSRVETTIDLRAEGDATRMTQVNRVEGVSRLQWLVQQRIARRELPRQLERLRAILESSD